MRISELSEQQYRRYYEARLKGVRTAGVQIRALCPFHDDHTPTNFYIHPGKGTWYCHVCKQGGGVLDLEKRLGNLDTQAALANIADILGEKQAVFSSVPTEHFPYQNASGVNEYRTARRGSGKGKVVWYERWDHAKGTWYVERGKQTVPPDLFTLYHLPEVVRAAEVMFFEGEKKCDRVRECLEAAEQLGPVAATTSPRGAGKYCDRFSPYFAGKKLLIYPDNDDVGRAHALAVAQSAYRYANGIKIVELPDLPPKGDAYDFLEKHTFEELVQISKQAPCWRPEDRAGFAVTCSDFEKGASDSIDWLVEGLWENGCNGMDIAPPKAGKTWALLDKMLALASGQTWLDFYIPSPRRCLLVSREDNPRLTKQRLDRLLRGRGLSAADLDGQFWLNSRRQTSRFMLEDQQQVEELIRTATQVRAEVIAFDVMRTIHGKDENDNTEMQEVLGTLNRIQAETGASLAVVHHASKHSMDGPISEMARGASAIAGWCEWLVALRLIEDDEEPDEIRRFQAITKSAISPAPFHWKVATREDGGVILGRTEYQTPQRKWGRRIHVSPEED